MTVNAVQSRDDRFLIMAAQGNQGRILIPKLLDAGCKVRACVRTEASAEQLRARGVEDVIVGDILEPGTLARALDGVTTLYHIGPSAHPQEREMGFKMIDAARAGGVRHFVFSSVLHAITTDLVQHEIKRDIEEHLLSSGLEFTILQPANYMMPHRLPPAFEHGVFRLPWSLERYQSMVDVGDIVEVALKVLLEGERHYSATYELVAEGRYTAHDIAAVIAEVIGRPVSTELMDGEAYVSLLFGDDPSQVHQKRVVRALIARYSANDFLGNPNVLTWLLGRRPTSFEEFVRVQYAEFQRKRAEQSEKN